MQYFLAIAFDQLEKGAIRLIRASEKSPQPFYINNTPFSHSVSFLINQEGSL